MLHGLMPWPDSQTVKARSKLFWGLEAEAAASWPLWLPGFLASWLLGYRLLPPSAIYVRV